MEYAIEISPAEKKLQAEINKISCMTKATGHSIPTWLIEEHLCQVSVSTSYRRIVWYRILDYDYYIANRSKNNQRPFELYKWQTFEEVLDNLSEENQEEPEIPHDSKPKKPVRKGKAPNS